MILYMSDQCNKFIIKHTDIYPPGVKLWQEIYPDLQQQLIQQCELYGVYDWQITSSLGKDGSTKIISIQYWKSEEYYNNAVQKIKNHTAIKIRNEYFQKSRIQRQTEYYRGVNDKTA